jgi:hypothetical protein
MLHAVSAAYGQRPSELLRVSDPWAAYQLDAATLLLGREVEAAILRDEDVDALLDGQPGEPDAGQFRSPVGLVTKTMKIPESGIW